MRSALQLFAIGVFVLTSTSNACVRFDVKDTATCIPLPCGEIAAQSDLELLRIELDISAFVQLEYSQDLAQFVYVIEFPERKARIVGFSPTTELITEIEGTTSVSTQTESSS